MLILWFAFVKLN